MLHAILLAAVVTGSAATAPNSAIADCFAANAHVAACTQALAEVRAMRPITAAHGPQTLLLTARILDRSAMLSHGDSATALRNVKVANLYFRVASGLSNQSAVYHEVAVENMASTAAHLEHARADVALANEKH